MTCKAYHITTDKIDVIDNMKEHFEDLFNSSLAEFKDRLSAGIFSLELGILYNNRVYDQRVLDVQDVFLKLSDDIDNSLNNRAKQCFEEIQQLFDDIYFDSRISSIFGTNKVDS